MVAIKEVIETDDIVIVTSEGMIIRQHASDIRVAGRNTQGVRLIRLKEGDTIADVAAVVAEEEEEKQLAEQEKKGPDAQTSFAEELDRNEKKSLKTKKVEVKKSKKTGSPKKPVKKSKPAGKKKRK